MANKDPSPKTRFTSSNQPPSKGRKKNKLKLLVEESDLSSDDISNLIKKMFELTEDELKALVGNKEKPFLLRAYARALFDDAQQGRLYNINTMLERAIGKVTEKREISTKDDKPIKMVMIKDIMDS